MGTSCKVPTRWCDGKPQLHDEGREVLGERGRVGVGSDLQEVGLFPSTEGSNIPAP